MSKSLQELLQLAQELLASGHALVQITLLHSEGHVPQEPGAKALVTAVGLVGGTVGGGKVEAKAIRHAQELLLRGEKVHPQLLSWDLQKDLGMSCGGRVQMLFECLQSQPWTLAIFGAGHIAQALTRILIQLDCAISCFDPRQEWIEKLPLASNLKAICAPDLPSLARDLLPETYCVLLTQGHSSDLPILKELLRRTDLSYLGVIGSKVKARALRAELLRDGFTKEQLQNFHCPIGLPIGSHHPGEIAISIIAQLLQTRDAKSAYVRKSVKLETMGD
ncbi:MAG: xanthine dehydrogenase accessory protein XdhC [Proteobacteria bacterium]|nr:xanthine dehydrogenase accessory protein XdhC [Pseudomonadota bacterium]